MITTLAGQNRYLIKTKQKELEINFKKANDNGSIEKIDAIEYDFRSLVEWLSASSLFSQNRMLIVDSISKNISLVEKIETILSLIDDGIELLFVELELDMRTKFAKLLQKKTNFIRFDNLKQYAIAPWLVEEAKKRNGLLNKKDAEYLVARVGDNQAILSSELDKLLIYNNHVTRESIDLLTDQQPLSKIFELLNMAFNKRKDEVVRLFEEQRKQQIDSQQILSMIAWQLHVFFLMKYTNPNKRDRLIKEAGISPYVVQNSETLVKKISRKELTDYTDKVIQLEIDSKNQAIFINDAVLALMLEIAS